MIGVFPVEKKVFNCEFPKALVDTLDAYLAKLLPRPSRNFAMMDACVEYLKARGVDIPPFEDSDLEE